MNTPSKIGGDIRRIACSAVGAGLKPQHYAEIVATRPDVGFFEIHAENYMSAGGPPHRWLSALAEIYPLSVHGVGLSLGSAEKLDHERLARLVRVVGLYQPALVSEHLAWSDFSGRAFPDLLPLPYDEANCRRVAEKIDAAQTALGRPILIENPATYLRFQADALDETQFLDELAQRSGCGLLLDVNNVHVSAVNHGFDARVYLDAFPLERVGEIHLAGFAEARDAHGAFLIDDHGGQISEAVWALYVRVLRRAGPRPTLIEWDNEVPEWVVLQAETRKASAIMDALPRPACGERVGVRGRVMSPDDDRIVRLRRSTTLQIMPPPLTPALSLRERGEGAQTIGAGDWQRDFAEALQDPALPAPALFAPCDAPARFAVYRNNSIVGAISALREQFPSVALLVGDEAFADLARAHADKHPPRSPVLGEYGADFPDFVAEFLDQCDARAQTPYLPDVARFDWAKIKALRAEEAAPCPSSRLAQLDPAKLVTTRVTLHSSLSLVVSDWPILAISRAHGSSVEDWRGETVVVLRPQAELVCSALPPAAAAFLCACGEGETLGEAALAAAAQDGNFDFGRTLVELTEIGAFVDFTQGPCGSCLLF
jgi:uncharacterized protein (UPF0276 family)